ncbi:MAG: PEGA domain-containing protein [Myxococcales bacterium]
MIIRLRRTVFLAVLFGTVVSHAQSAPDSVGARAHFTEGLAHVERGEFGDALQEFEAAYALKPHYSVLYNIGQAHAALNHPADAVRSFERYLSEGGVHLSQSRRDEVRSLIASNRARLGELRIVGLSDTTRVWIDGLEIEPQRLSEPLQLAAGEHRLLSSRGEGFPDSQEARIVPGGVVELRLPSKPQGAPSPQAISATAQLKVICELAGVSVEINGSPRGTTPLRGPLLVPAGPLTIRFSRAGYRTETQHVSAPPSGSSTALCNQVRKPNVAPSFAATLVARTVPVDATISVDGERFLGAPLPYGPHELRVERTGFVPQQRAIYLRPRELNTFQIVLQATAERQAAQARAQSRRKVVGYATAGGGLALGVIGAVLLTWNGDRFDAWKREPGVDAGEAENQRIASIQRVDDIAIGCTALGAGLIATGIWFLVTRPSEAATY